MPNHNVLNQPAPRKELSRDLKPTVAGLEAGCKDQNDNDESKAQADHPVDSRRAAAGLRDVCVCH